MTIVLQKAVFKNKSVRSGFKFYLVHSNTVCLWTSYLASLRLIFIMILLESFQAS